MAPKLEQHRVKYDGDKEIFYLAAGPSDGQLIIFLHGWPAIAQTWAAQLETFASLGFRVVAPDCPGYGRSTARRASSDYAQEAILTGLLAVLANTGHDKAVWVGHDWGCGSLWTIANTRPDVCRAVAGLAVPYGVLEYGLEEIVKHVNRDIYPAHEYPWGQWSYMAFYETSLEAATEFFEKDIEGFLKACYARGSPRHAGKLAPTANVVKDRGWFGGAAQPPSAELVPDSAVVIDRATMQALVSAMEKTGFYPANSWYVNHQANKAFNLAHTKNDRKLKMPVLFIEASWDTVCDTKTTNMAMPMKQLCDDLTYVSIDAGHWVAQEKTAETSAAIARWLVERVTDWWPDTASRRHSKM